MSKVSAKWMPRQASADQKAIRVTNAKKHLSRFNREGDMFLNRIITGDEMWVHYSEPETKAQSKQWKRAGSPPPKNFKLSPSAGKAMLVAFFGFERNDTYSFQAKGSTCHRQVLF
jgi:hypothetical protein